MDAHHRRSLLDGDIDVDGENYTIELTGPGDKLDAFLAAMPAADILEVVRSGVSGIARGERSLRL